MWEVDQWCLLITPTFFFPSSQTGGGEREKLSTSAYARDGRDLSNEANVGEGFFWKVSFLARKSSSYSSRNVSFRSWRAEESFFPLLFHEFLSPFQQLWWRKAEKKQVVNCESPFLSLYPDIILFPSYSTVQGEAGKQRANRCSPPPSPLPPVQI